MLILSRRADEALQIGDDIVVTVLEVRGSAVHLGISAPPEVRVLRDELIEELQGADPVRRADVEVLDG